MGSKIIPSNYPPIQHLPGSKMRDASDKSLGEQEVGWLTVQTRKKDDTVIITEKVDGCNVGVFRRGNNLFPIMRKGYDVRTSPYDWINAFATFVEKNRTRFLGLLSEGERVCGDWMIKTHTVSYNLPHEPLVCFDIIKGSARVPYLTTLTRLQYFGFIGAGVVHCGGAMSTDMAVARLGSGFHGAVGEPEGVVYRYESAEHGWLFSAKYVSNPHVGDQALFESNIKNGIMNRWIGGTYF